MENLGLVSVVIPVYKAEATIEKCVRSVLSQTYPHFEIILVDDGSPDKSGQICDELAKEDSRIWVIHKENGGVSTARNRGVEAAKGDYLIFIDSDDWVEKNHLQVLLPKGDEDLVYGGLRFFVKGEFVENRCVPVKIAYQEEWVKDYVPFGMGIYTVFFIIPLYKMDIIKGNQLLFDEELGIGEDGLFNLRYIKHCKSIRYENSCTYCYEDGDENTVSQSRKFHKNRMQAEMLTNMAIEEITGRPEYKLRHHHWIATFNHIYKWKKIGSPDVRCEAIKSEKECYRNKYFRECIPYIRKYGTLDQKIETYFMSYLLHPIYKPFYGLVVALSNLKNKIVN